MSQDSLFDYPSGREEDLQPFWSLDKAKLKVQDPVVVDDPAPVGSCGFVGARLFEGSVGRKCTLGGCCFLFCNVSDYGNCPSRAEKLKEQT